jgi:hypothetical protein
VPILSVQRSDFGSDHKLQNVAAEGGGDVDYTALDNGVS